MIILRQRNFTEDKESEPLEIAPGSVSNAPVVEPGTNTSAGTGFGEVY